MSCSGTLSCKIYPMVRRTAWTILTLGKRLNMPDDQDGFLRVSIDHNVPYAWVVDLLHYARIQSPLVEPDHVSAFSRIFYASHIQV